MANSPTLQSGLTGYVDQQRLPLIAAAVLGGKTSKLFNLQTGIKSQAAINLVNANIVFGNGKLCGWNEAGTTGLSQRVIKVGNYKVNMAICDKTLLDTWAGYQVQVAAGTKTLPFEEYFMNAIIGKVQEELDKALWQGDTTGSGNTSFADGIVKILTADASSSNKITITAGSSYLKAVETVLKAIPDAVIGKNDVCIFADPAFVRNYKLELIGENLYHYDATADAEDIVIPGSNVKLVAVGGLTGSKKLVAGSLSNMFYGTDMQGDEEKVDLWYSQDNREFRLAIEFNAGVQVAYPDECIIGTYTTLS